MSDYSDLDWDDIQEIENELDMEYDPTHDRFVSNQHPKNPGSPQWWEIEQDNGEVQDYLEKRREKPWKPDTRLRGLD